MLNMILKKEIYGPIITVLVAILVYMICKKAIAKWIKNKNKDKNSVRRSLTIVKLFQNIFKYILIVVSTLIILQIYGVNVQTIIAGLGIVGLIVGLALQDTIRDFLSGLSIIFDDYYALGDWIIFKGFKGEVIEFGLRSTKVKSNNGDIMTFANRNVTEIINFSKLEATLVLDITADLTSLNKVIDKVLKDAYKKIIEMENVSSKGSLYIGMNELLGGSAIYRMEIRCKSSKEFEIKREVLKILKNEYDKNKVMPPYPKAEVHNGNKI